MKLKPKEVARRTQLASYHLVFQYYTFINYVVRYDATPQRHSPYVLIFCMHASMSSVVSISAPDEAVRPKLQSCSDKLFGH